MTGQLVIVESPYSGDVEANVAYARDCVADCIRRGEHPVASHLLLTQPGILDDLDAEERKRGMEAGWAWYRVADLAVVYVDRGLSRGMLDGLDAARAAGVEVEVRSLHGDYALRRSVLAFLRDRFLGDAR